MNMKFLYKLFLPALVFVLVGMLAYLTYSDVLLFRITWKLPRKAHDVAVVNYDKTLFLYLPGRTGCKIDSTVIWKDDDQCENVRKVVAAWLEHMYTMGAIRQQVMIFSVLRDADETFLSFSKSFLDSEWSVEEKWLFVEALLKTLRVMFPDIRFFHFLQNSQKMEDFHIDFSQKWPSEGFKSFR